MLIQVLLMAGAFGLLLILLRRRTAVRTRAWKRLILVGLVCVAIITILRPEVTTKVANLVGVGRGADLLLYLLIAVFLYVVMGFYLKFKDVERQLTLLSRRQALADVTRLESKNLRKAHSKSGSLDDDPQ